MGQLAGMIRVEVVSVHFGAGWSLFWYWRREEPFRVLECKDKCLVQHVAVRRWRCGFP